MKIKIKNLIFFPALFLPFFIILVSFVSSTLSSFSFQIIATPHKTEQYSIALHRTILDNIIERFLQTSTHFSLSYSFPSFLRNVLQNITCTSIAAWRHILWQHTHTASSPPQTTPHTQNRTGDVVPLNRQYRQASSSPSTTQYLSDD